MKYQCLRDCFTSASFYREGMVYDLPDAMPKSAKNFAPVEAVKEPEKAVVPENNLKCPVCGRECKSAFGLYSHRRSHNGGK